jgi:sugar lactone lactonase YvrE
MKNRRFIGTALLAAGLMLVQATTSAQVVTTLAGSGAKGSADGNGSAASFSDPQGLAADRSGNVYVADTGSSKIRKITPDGLVTTFAGNGHSGYQDGPAATAGFFGPLGVAADASGNVWVADQDDGIDGQYVKKITPDAIVHNLILYPGLDPVALALDNSGSLYVLDASGGLWKITADGNPTVLAALSHASGVAVDREGNAYVTYRNQILKITPTGAVTTLAGSGSPGSADGTGTAASFRGPIGLAVGSSGNVYVADYGNQKIRRITSTGTVTTLAGSGSPGSADGTGAAASFNLPTGVALDYAENLYVADSGNNKIRKIALRGARPREVLDLSVRPDDTTCLLRFDGVTGQVSLDTLDEAGSVASGNLFGPYEGWTPRATTTSLDGLTRVLWNNQDGSAALWLTSPAGNQASFRLGPVNGAAAVDVAAAIAGTTHVLWSYANGGIAVWSVDNAGHVSTGPAYGPFPAWTVVAIADGQDGLSRILWRRSDGSAGLSLFGAEGPIASYRLGPVAGWAAMDLAVGADGQTRILWTHLDGRMALWRVDDPGNPTALGPIYPPPSGFTASRVAAGPDGLTRVLWTDVNGNAVLWILSADNVLQRSFDLGPAPAAGIAGAWTGTFDSADFVDCDSGTPAQASFTQDGEVVVGTLNAPNDCGFTNATFRGTLRGETLGGTVTGDRFTNAVAKGTLSSSSLEITITNGFGLIPGGRMHLHR